MLEGDLRIVCLSKRNIVQAQVASQEETSVNRTKLGITCDHLQRSLLIEQQRPHGRAIAIPSGAFASAASGLSGLAAVCVRGGASQPNGVQPNGGRKNGPETISKKRCSKNNTKHMVLLGIRPLDHQKQLFLLRVWPIDL